MLCGGVQLQGVKHVVQLGQIQAHRPLAARWQESSDLHAVATRASNEAIYIERLAAGMESTPADLPRCEDPSGMYHQHRQLRDSITLAPASTALT